MSLAVIVVMMIPSFRIHVLPKILAKLGEGLLRTGDDVCSDRNRHRTRGTIHLAVCGHERLPRKLRITKYKVWMRTVLVLWWVALLLGLAACAPWYIPHLLRK